MILNIILLVVGFFLLIKGADLFVDGASSTAENLKISKMLIGLTIIAFGTSAPEFAVSIKALSSNSTDMVLGNVIGSCIMNIFLILGIAAIINPINIKSSTIKKELPLTMLISSLLIVLFLDKSLDNDLVNKISRVDAIVILLFFTIFLYYLINLAKVKKDSNDKFDPKHSILKSLLLIAIGLIGIFIGSNLVVEKASSIATSVGVSERIISLSIIAFGTSLPEFVTTIVSSKKKEQDLLLGNIVGSNIFNICVVLGIPVAIFGSITPSSFQNIDLIMLFLSSLLLFIFSKTHKVISRLEGLFLVLAFIIYYVFIFVI